MKAISLFIALCLLPLGGWADTLYCDYTTVYTSNPPVYACTVNGKKVMMTNEQINDFGEDQPKADSNYKGWLDSGEEIHLPRSKDDDRLQSYAEKCDYWMGVMERRILEQKHDSFADVATAYCTRALLEEMKK